MVNAILSKLKSMVPVSRKMRVMLIAVAGVAINKYLGDPLDHEMLLRLLGVAVAWILGQGIADMGKHRPAEDTESVRAELAAAVTQVQAVATAVENARATRKPRAKKVAVAVAPVDDTVPLGTEREG